MVPGMQVRWPPMWPWVWRSSSPWPGCARGRGGRVSGETRPAEPVHGLSCQQAHDSEARDQIGGIIMDGFIRRKPGFEMPARLGMLSEAADLDLWRALAAYIES